MDFKNIAGIRLASQQIVATKCKTAKEVVAWMGAMQAQDTIWQNGPLAFAFRLQRMK